MSTSKTMKFADLIPTDGNDGFFSNDSVPEPLDLKPTIPGGKTTEEILKEAYLNHPGKFMTRIQENGQWITVPLTGLIFPAHELAAIIGNQETEIKSVAIEFCYHVTAPTNPPRSKGFSLILTGLDKDDYRIRSENGESRVYEFAQSCPPKCPK